ncbi:MAG: tetratricopeptide repeat protein [Methylocystis sp.]|uniref:tetratricopeptide repeat protein n=1 Tax=Methylocystis sp. TaxID=1911079 RepID=UPI003DA5087F
MAENEEDAFSNSNAAFGNECLSFCWFLLCSAAKGKGIKSCSAGTPDERIAGCTALIGDLSPSELAAVYDGRCWAFNLQEDYSRALKDCDMEIQLRPDYAYAHNNRGVSLEKLGRLDEALLSLKRPFL